ncbi:DUF262 domain-containing protein [Stenotrophomonas maltophilia]|uniref:DUF262 domain-containing protein n=1 Tax=Stenotrophomonas maltophilia TaxID=40324 RepID=UPI0021DA2AE8|nr:DUF262 domain-containing protein [Stenotrophomonas maltophilia]MDZ5843022.1 DUF262 domain-containing protein [Stenotrophomonas maltophilia]UXY48712.1 DUF262 domain-containing protein [Stenotrophomonas maltophilia]
MEVLDANKDWFDDDQDSDVDGRIDEYEISSSPNDFNVATIFSFIKSGAVKIPGFQRHFVWDIKRASKLIESLILGLPVPQIFLYEDARNSFLVIDGQQRLMSIYYFMLQRFPRQDRRAELRAIFDKYSGDIPLHIIDDDEYFVSFKLKLPEQLPGNPSRFNGLNYSTLGDYKVAFDLRTVRNIIVKQATSTGNDSAVFEIFNRLNSGGVNLTPQEIRASMYHSDFYAVLQRMNSKPGWRQLVGREDLDLHMKDVEILLRAFALLVDADSYAPSMTKFLNLFSKKSKGNTPEHNLYLERIFDEFLVATSRLPSKVFFTPANNRFNISLFESVFYAACKPVFDKRAMQVPEVSITCLNKLRSDPGFISASSEGTSKSDNVYRRLSLASAIIGG